MARKVEIDVIGRDRASHAFNSAGRSADGAGRSADGAGQRFRAMGALIGRAAVATAAGVGIVAAAGVALGVKTAAANEQAMISFETLLGSGRKAEKFYSGLKKFAAETPFEMPGLTMAAKQLLGVGESASQVIPILRSWGDASGALGLSEEQFSRAMLARNQAMAKGKLQAEEMMQITEAGIPVYGLLSRALGKPVAEIQKLGSEGKLLSKDVLPALEKQLSKEYGGAMAKQAKTLTGLWSTFKDTLSQGLADAIIPLIPYLKSALPVAIEGTGKALKFIGNTIGGTIRFVKFLRQEFAFLGPPIRDLASKFVPWLKSTLSEMKTAFGDSGEAMNTVKGVAQALMPVISFLAKAIGSNLKSNLVVTSAIIGRVVLPAIRLMTKQFLDTVGAILTGAAKAFGWVPGVGPKLKRAAREFSTFRDRVNRTLDGIRDENVYVNVRMRRIGSGPITSSTQWSTGVRGMKVMGKGGPARRGEWAVVGEEGPELVHFGTNANVTPSTRSRQLLEGKGMAAGGGGVTIVLQSQVVGSQAEVVRWVYEGARQAQRAGLLPKGAVTTA